MAEIYIKRGAKNSREYKMISQIQEAIAKKKSENPNYVFDKTCRSFQELRNLHTEMCAEDVSFEEVVNDKEENGKLDFDGIELKDEFKDKVTSTKEEVQEKFTDPFNQSNPTVRDYVTNKGFTNDDHVKQSKTSFDEPLSFDEAFEIPEAKEEDDSGNSNTKSNKTSSSKQRSKREPSEPINPDFGNMTASQQKKNTKQFATFIVEAVCTLAERGFVYYANMDINEQKLIEYEINGEMDLSILLTMDNGQKMAVKTWFLQQNLVAQELAVIPQSDRDELASALADVLLEKGFAPSPTQVLLIKVGTVFLVDKGLKLMQLKMTTNSVLEQLRIMAKQTSEDTDIVNETETEQNKTEVSDKENLENETTTDTE